MRSYKSTMILISVVMILSLISLFVSVVDLDYALIFSRDKETIEMLVISRLPRLLAILCTGVAMIVAGLIMQQLCQNKFVSPTTGVTISLA